MAAGTVVGTPEAATDEVRTLERRLQLLAEVTRAFVEDAHEPARLLQTVARRIAEVIGDSCTVLVLTDEGRELRGAATYDPDPETLRLAREVMEEPLLLDRHPIARSVIETGEPVLIEKIDPEHLRPPATTQRYYEFCRAIGQHSMLIVPLRGHARPIGELVLTRHHAGQPPFDRRDLELAKTLADHAALVIEHSRAFAEELAQRHAAEEASSALQESIEHARQFFEGSKIAMYAFAAQSERLIAVNDAALELYGYTRAEFLALSMDALRSPEDLPRIHAANRALGDNAMRGPARHRRKDGTMLEIEGSSHLGSYGGHPARFATVLDVTERNHLREAMATEAMFRAFLETAPDAIVIFDRTLTIVLVNRRTEELFGHPRSHLIGQPFDVLLPAKDRDRQRALIAQTYADHAGGVLGSELEFLGQCADGTQVPIEISLSPLQLEDGLLVTAVIRDVSERRAIHLALQNANRELEAFSYSVAHDLRSPLRAINGYAQMLLGDYAHVLPEEASGWLLQITAGAKTMTELVDALLSLARISRSAPRTERVDVTQLARQVSNDLAARDPDRQLTVEVEEGLVAELDPQLARVVFENLLGNARKFTAGVPTPRIEVGVTVTDGRRAMFVRDNGVGFDMAYVGKLFGPFQRLHPTTEFPGTGIGLATVQRIVHRHGGRIWAESELGRGATFWFTVRAP